MAAPCVRTLARGIVKQHCRARSSLSAQIATKVEVVYEVTMPLEVRNAVRYISVIVNIGLGTLSSLLQCIGAPSFYSRLLFFFIGPMIGALIILGSITCYLALIGRLRKRTVIRAFLPPLLRYFFILYPIVCNVAFEVRMWCMRIVLTAACADCC